MVCMVRIACFQESAVALSIVIQSVHISDVMYVNLDAKAPAKTSIIKASWHPSSALR